MNLLALFFGLAVGNFIFAYFTEEYEKAVDRTFFQAIALVAVAFFI